MHTKNTFGYLHKNKTRIVGCVINITIVFVLRTISEHIFLYKKEIY